MKSIVLIIAVLLIFIFGLYITKRADRFIHKNEKR